MKALSGRLTGALRSPRRATRTLTLVLLAMAWAPLPARAQQDVQAARAEVDRLTAEVEAQWVEILALFESFTEAQGEERLIIDAQIDRRTATWRPLLAQLIQDILAFEQAGGQAPEARAKATEWLTEARRLVRDELGTVQDRMTELRVQRGQMAREDMLPLERQIAQVGADVDALLLALYRVGAFRASFGLDPASDWSYVDPLLASRADRLVGEVELSQSELRALSSRVEQAVGDEERIVRSEINAVQARLSAGTTGLAAVVDLMDQRELETAEYKQVLIQATGQVTTDVLDWEVASGLLRQGWRSLVAWGLSRAPQLIMNLVLFLIILGVFHILARMTRRVANAAITRANPNVPKLLKSVGVSIIANSVFLLGILIGLSQLGIHVGPLLAGLGVAGFIMGFALQDTLSNFASGLMILVYRPFDVGDVVEAGGVGGKVSHMSLVSTTILTFDNQKLIVPNREIWGNVIRNKTSEETRRVDLSVSVGDRSDVARAVDLLQGLLDNHPLVLEDPEPVIKVNRVGDEGTDLIVRPWVETTNYWTVFWDVTRQMNDELAAAGISRPFNRSELLIDNRADQDGGGAWTPQA
jgi:small conductance mechanosensitive channel